MTALAPARIMSRLHLIQEPGDRPGRLGANKDKKTRITAVKPLETKLDKATSHYHPLRANTLTFYECREQSCRGLHRNVNLNDSNANLTSTIFQYLSLHNNPWTCDCKLKKFRDLVVKKNLLTDPSETVCHEPERITGQMWAKVSSQDFACKPEVEVLDPTVVGRPGTNATLRCKITGNPVPGVKWVLNGRIIQNNSAPLHTKNPDQVYVIEDLALAEGECECEDDASQLCFMFAGGWAAGFYLAQFRQSWAERSTT